MGNKRTIDDRIDAEIEQYKLEWETHDQWKLRRKFLLRNWADYEPDNRISLLSRSQCFINMLFMQCKYDAELEEEVNYMAGDISKLFIEERRIAVCKVIGDDPKAKRKARMFEKQQNNLGTRAVKFPDKPENEESTQVIINDDSTQAKRPRMTLIEEKPDDNEKNFAKIKKGKSIEVSSKVEDRIEQAPPTFSLTDSDLKTVNDLRDELLNMANVQPIYMLQAACKRLGVMLKIDVIPISVTNSENNEPPQIYRIDCYANKILLTTILSIDPDNNTTIAKYTVDRLKRDKLIIKLDSQSSSQLYAGTELESNSPSEYECQEMYDHIKEIVKETDNLTIAEDGSLNAMQNLCALKDIPLEWRSKQLRGWSAELSGYIGGVRALPPIIVKGGKKKEEYYKDQYCFKMITQLRSPFIDVIQRNDNILVLWAGEVPLSQEEKLKLQKQTD